MKQPKDNNPYVFQPHGITDPFYRQEKRFYGVGGLSVVADIKGLTREEADCIVAALIELRKEKVNGKL